MNKFITLGILILAFLLRVPLLDQYPTGFTPDEASFGYDSYSLIQTGKDQWGKWFPLVLESFGDFKAPLYSYLLLPFIAIFGLETWVVRIPNALFGVLAVYVTYLLVLHFRLTYLHKNEIGKFRIEYLASFLLAISSWHVQLSRGAFEANLTALFMPLGILLFLKGLKNKSYLVYSGLVFGFNLFTYHSARLVTPLIVGMLILFFFKEIKKINLKDWYKPLFVFSLFLVLAFVTLFQGGTKRAQDVSIFRGALEAQADARLTAINTGVSPVIARITNNKYLIILGRFRDNYIKYFSYKYLVEKGPAEATYGMVPGIGVVYPIEAVGLVVFLFYTFFSKNKVCLFVLATILIAVIPASLTTGVGYAGNRAATMLPFLHIASALGILSLIYLLKRIFKQEYVVGISIGIVSLYLLSGLFENIKVYLDKQESVVAKSMLYGRLELVKYINDKYPIGGVVVSRRLSEPHIYFAFVNRSNPNTYQNNTKDWRRYREEGLTFLDQMYKYSLGRYTFKAIEKSDFDETNGSSIVVLLPDELPESITNYETISYPSGEVAIYIVKI